MTFKIFIIIAAAIALAYLASVGIAWAHRILTHEADHE